MEKNFKKENSIISFITAHLIPILGVFFAIVFYIINIQLDIAYIKADIKTLEGFKKQSLLESEKKGMIAQTNKDFLSIKKDIEDDSLLIKAGIENDLHRLESEKNRTINLIKLEINKMVNQADTRLSGIVKDIKLNKSKLDKIKQHIKKQSNTQKNLKKENDNLKQQIKIIDASLRGRLAEIDIRSSHLKEKCYIQYTAVHNENEEIKSLKKQLRDASFPAYIMYDKQAGLFKLRIGNLFDKKEAREELKKIKKVFPTSSYAPNADILCN